MRTTRHQLVVILCTLQQSFLTYCCFSNVGVHVSFYIERFIPKLVPAKDTLRVRHRGTPSFDTPVVTDLGEGARQKILKHQVFNRSVKVWVRCEDLLHPHVPYPLSTTV
jgi:hypothetical protein